MKKIILAPYIDQTRRWVNGCESISAVMALGAVGGAGGPGHLHCAATCPMPRSGSRTGSCGAPDPHYVYPGDPHDHTGYGCYAPCICQAMTSALEAAGAADRFAVVDETGRSAAELCGYIDQGLPVVFWATLDFQPVPGVDRWRLPNGRMFDWKLNEHCLLLVGYDQDRYWFNDPWHNHGLCAQPKELVEECHRAQDLYAVALRRK